jgi:hypothetical protein
MYAEHFAADANHATLQDPGFKGATIQILEFSALLEMFSHVDESNKRYLTVDDVKGLWIDGKFPQDWQPRTLWCTPKTGPWNKIELLPLIEKTSSGEK